MWCERAGGSRLACPPGFHDGSGQNRGAETGPRRNWLLPLYPARWRVRYGEEFGAALASQHASVGLVLDVLAGAVDAHLYPQIQNSQSKPIKGDDTMTLEMLQRCAVGGGQNFRLRIAGSRRFSC